MTNENKNEPPVSQRSTSGNNFNVSGDHNRVAGGDYHETNYGAGDPRKDVEDALKQLQQAAEGKPEAKALIVTAKDAVKAATAETPDAEEVETRRTMLQAAADNIKSVLPTVFDISTTLIAKIIALKTQG